MEPGEEGEACLEYDLYGAYDLLTFDIGAESGDANYYAADCGEARVRFYLDNNLAYDTGYFTYRDEYHGESLNVAGADTLLIKLTIRRGTGRTMNIVIGEPILTANVAQTEEPAATAPHAGDSLEEIILAGKSRCYSAEELDGYSKDELRRIRNGLYAMDGLMFTDDSLNRYYAQFDWYNPVTSDAEYIYELFNYYQEENVAVIVAVERSKGYRN